MDIIFDLEARNIFPPLEKIFSHLTDAEIRAFCHAHPSGKALVENLVLPSWSEEKAAEWRKDYWKGTVKVH